MRLFGGGKINLRSIMERGLPPGEPLNHPLINKSIERAQNKVEERNFEIRKHLLEFDDVLNEQRKMIYDQRDAILTDDNLKERVLTTAADIIQEQISEYEKSRGQDRALLSEFLASLKETLLYAPHRDEDELAELPPEELKQTLISDMRADLEEKAEIAGAEQLNMAIRYEYLRQIDQRWQDHLENLEALREAVYLRSYAQRNPLLEYKLEGFQIFDELIYNIRSAIARKLFAVRAEGFREARARAMQPAAHATAQHGSFQMIGGDGGGATGGGARPAGAGGGTATATRPEKAQVQRSYPKVGRNDPCPCGSGKKYKYCHGR
jgi:preprotein translocase subunit SecA